MNNTLEYEVGPVGLGISITLLSLLLSANRPLILYAPNNYTIIRDLKRIFNIADDKLTIVDREVLTDPLVGHDVRVRRITDYCKFWSPYLTSDSIQIKRNKPCIALATGDWLTEFPNNALPFNRYHSKEFWLKVVNLVISAGYEVITMNVNQVSVEQKTYVLTELCDAVIGYEGGVCHLAHSLKVPTIIMPWHHYEGGNDPHKDGSIKWIPHKMHRDPRTYFVESPEEILSWTTVTLKETINRLYLEEGNNIFLKESTLSKNYISQQWSNSTDFEREFVGTYIKKSAAERQLL